MDRCIADKSLLGKVLFYRKKGGKVLTGQGGFCRYVKGDLCNLVHYGLLKIECILPYHEKSKYVNGYFNAIKIVRFYGYHFIWIKMIDHGIIFYMLSMLSGKSSINLPTTLLITGASLFAGARIFGLVRTFVFPDIYNKKLRNALDVNGLVLNIEPALDMTERGVELSLVRLRF
jgi:hypothetical protein